MAKSPLETLRQIFDNLVTLNVVTAVGDVDLSAQTTGDQRIVIKPGAKVIWSSFDMVEGDIKTVIDPDFAGDAGKELRAFHEAREKQAQSIIKDNIDSLEKLLKLMVAHPDKPTTG